MTMHHPKLADLVRRDPRYAYEAYEFLFAALAHTQKMLGRQPFPETAADQDTRADFQDIYDLDQALVQNFRIELDEAEWSR